MQGKEQIDSIFVYGTLKRSHLRASLWPRPPLAVRSAVIRAALYDTGPYPAILEGDDWVLGELWTLNADDLPITLQVLDEVEGYGVAHHDNLYVRQETEATLEDGSRVRAYVYRYAVRHRESAFRRIPPHQHFAGQWCAAWPDSLSRVPQRFEEEDPTA